LCDNTQKCDRFKLGISLVFFAVIVNVGGPI
jgi:hypothetical protein